MSHTKSYVEFLEREGPQKVAVITRRKGKLAVKMSGEVHSQQDVVRFILRCQRNGQVVEHYLVPADNGVKYEPCQSRGTYWLQEVPEA